MADVTGPSIIDAVSQHWLRCARAADRRADGAELTDPAPAMALAAPWLGRCRHRAWQWRARAFIAMVSARSMN